MDGEYPRVADDEVVFSGMESSRRPSEIRRRVRPLLLSSVEPDDFAWLRNIAADREVTIVSGYQASPSQPYRLVRNRVTAEVALEIQDHLIRSPADCVCAEVYDVVADEIQALRGLLDRHGNPILAAWYERDVV
jgi:hypothetical protein